MLDQKEIKVIWPQVKTGVLKRWDKLNPNEVEMTEGRVNALQMLVQEIYGRDAEFIHSFEDICAHCVANGAIKKPMTPEKSQKLDANKKKIKSDDPEITNAEVPEDFHDENYEKKRH